MLKAELESMNSMLHRCHNIFGGAVGVVSKLEGVKCIGEVLGIMCCRTRLSKHFMMIGVSAMGC